MSVDPKTWKQFQLAVHSAHDLNTSIGWIKMWRAEHLIKAFDLGLERSERNRLLTVLDAAAYKTIIGDDQIQKDRVIEITKTFME